MAVREAVDVVRTNCVYDPANDADALVERKRRMSLHHSVQSASGLHPRQEHERLLRLVAHSMNSEAVVLKADFGAVLADEVVARFRRVEQFLKISLSTFQDFGNCATS